MCIRDRAEHRPGLRALGYRILHLAVNRGHDDLVAEHSLRECNRDIAPHIKAVAFEQRVRAQRNHDIHITGRSAVDALITLATQSKRLPVVDAGRDRNLQRACFAHAAHTVTVGARLLDDLALSGAFRAGARSLDHADRRALLHLDLACAAAVGARFRRGDAFGAAAAACLAFFQALHLYCLLYTSSYGDDAERVAADAAAFATGLQESGVLAVAKHYPGHGDTSIDSHYGLPSVNKTLEELRSLELIPFNAVQNADIGAVMAAHIVFPQIDSTGLPATLSQPCLLYTSRCV